MNGDVNLNNIANMPKQTYDLISQIIKFIDESDREKGEQSSDDK